MRPFKGFLTLLGVLALTSAGTGIRSVQAVPNGVAVEWHEGWRRALAAALAVALFTLLLGVHRRKLLAWRLGGLGFAAAVLAAAITTVIQGPLPAVLGVFAAAGMLAVGAHWGVWWWRQRVHFDPPPPPKPAAPPAPGLSLSPGGVVLLGIGAYAVFAAAIWFGIGSLNMPVYRRLADEGVPAEATVTEPTCENHATVRYAFRVDGRTFTGVGQPSAVGRDCADVRAGDRLEVWYVPADPGIHRLGAPGPNLRNEEVSVGLAAVGMPAFLVVVSGGAYLRRKAAATPGGRGPAAGL
ncbi:MAG TPA: DUF3592 domain-containing protein [Urbifossiella sp.]|jgi:hypothetical protein|nr:DUF3592 domain-containing protein [Urbifossiella sp.]